MAARVTPSSSPSLSPDRSEGIARSTPPRPECCSCLAQCCRSIVAAVCRRQEADEVRRLTSAPKHRPEPTVVMVRRSQIPPAKDDNAEEGLGEIKPIAVGAAKRVGSPDFAIDPLDSRYAAFLKRPRSMKYKTPAAREEAQPLDLDALPREIESRLSPGADGDPIGKTKRSPHRDPSVPAILGSIPVTPRSRSGAAAFPFDVDAHPSSTTKFSKVESSSKLVASLAFKVVAHEEGASEKGEERRISGGREVRAARRAARVKERRSRKVEGEEAKPADAASFPKSARIPVMTREEAQRRIFAKFPRLHEEIAVVRDVIRSMSDEGAKASDMAIRVRRAIGSTGVEKLPGENAHVILGSGNAGGCGLYLGADIMKLRRNPFLILSPAVVREMSIIQANESSGVLTSYGSPEHYFEVYHPANEEMGVTTWEDLLSVSGSEMEPLVGPIERGNPEEVVLPGSSTGEEAKEPLWKLFNVIDNALLREGSEGVYTHCTLGEDRSSCIVMLYLINRLGLSYEEALVYLIAKRPQAYPLKIGREIQTYAERINGVERAIFVHIDPSH